MFVLHSEGDFQIVLDFLVCGTHAFPRRDVPQKGFESDVFLSFSTKGNKRDLEALLLCYHTLGSRQRY